MNYYTFYKAAVPRNRLLRKTLLVMKITTLILLIALMQVSAASVAQRITFVKKNASLEQVFQEITRQTGYEVFYGDKKFDDSRKINVAFKDATLDEVLKTCLQHQRASYVIEEKSIIIKPAVEPSFLERLADHWAAIDVHGRVVDQEGKPLSGATVKIKSTGKGVIANAKGEFYLEKVEEDAVLVVSFIGYVGKEVSARKEIGDVVLEVAIGELDEVAINKGYYTTDRQLNTGSVGTLTAKDISKQPVSDPLMALEGRIPGLFVSQNSGVPGASLNVNIRGINSIANGLEPLYIIDGIPFNSKSLTRTSNAAYSSALSPFASLRPDDIERIDVLKDADATAIYGSRGANGVVLITTKRGKSGVSRLDFNIYQGAGKVTKRFDMMNTQQYLEMRNEAFKNDNAAPTQFDYDVNGTWNQNNYTDWQKVLIGNTANTTDAKATMTGGNELNQYLLGFGYRRETTVYPGDYRNQILSGNFNFNHQSMDKRFVANFNSVYSYNDNRLPITDFTASVYQAPNSPALYDGKGQLNWENNTFFNPLGAIRQKATAVSENLLSNLSLSYKIISQLQIKINAGYNSMRMDDNNIIPFSSLIPSSFNPTLQRSNRIGNNNVKTIIVEPQLTFDQKFGDHHLDMLVAGTAQRTTQSGGLQTGIGFSSDLLIENIGAATIVSVNSSYLQYKYVALFGRIGYNYKDKYVLNLTGRRDGSSRFGDGKQFGNFGAIGTAWIFSKESFINNILPFLSLGKLRASIGRTGNDQISDYNYLSTYAATVGYFGASGLLPFKLANSDYGWETINKREVALELGFINNRILLNMALYRNRTGNQLVGYSLPAITGFTTIIANLPAVIENKGLEIDLSSEILKGHDFNWSSTFNISFPKNKLVSYPNIEGSSYATRYAIGEPLTVKRVYHYTGVDPKTGLYTVQDMDNDGIINSVKDRYFVFGGQKYFGGLSNTFNYKSVSLDVFLQFVKQTGYNYAGISVPGRFSRIGSNMPVDFLERWRSSGDVATYQRFSANPGDAANAFDRYIQSDALITDASYIRLKNVSLSWQMPKIWIEKVRLQSARIYLQAQNLLTITDFKGLDPESQQFGVSTPFLPPLRVITAGIQLSL